MSRSHIAAMGIGFLAGWIACTVLPDATPPMALAAEVNDTSDETIARVRRSLTGSKWNLGDGEWQHFLSDMKTTNQLDRTGNWVVTDGRTALTGGRGTEGAVYIWKFDANLQRATITKYTKEQDFSRRASRIE